MALGQTKACFCAVSTQRPKQFTAATDLERIERRSFRKRLNDISFPVQEQSQKDCATTKTKNAVAMPSKNKKKTQPVRGNAIRFTRGTYVGKTGWANVALAETASSIHVIVNEEQDANEDSLHLACVRKTSVAHYRNPESLEEYCLQEDAKVAYHLSKLGQALAECGVATNKHLMILIKEQLDLAYAAQMEKGRQAKFSESTMRLYKHKAVEKDQVMPDASSAGARKKAT